MGLHRILLLCYKFEVLRIVPYFFHCGEDFFFRGNINHPHRRKINIYLHMAVTAGLVAVVDFDTLNQRIDKRGGNFPPVCLNVVFFSLPLSQAAVFSVRIPQACAA